MRVLGHSIFIILALLASHASAADAVALVINNDNYVAIMRHTLALETSDPSKFDANDSRTQRNLSEEDRMNLVTHQVNILAG